LATRGSKAMMTKTTRFTLASFSCIHEQINPLMLRLRTQSPLPGIYEMFARLLIFGNVQKKLACHLEICFKILKYLLLSNNIARSASGGDYEC
jgi:hypothetical protein